MNYARQKTAMHELLDWVRRQPIDAAAEPFAARDHDQILYGEPK